MSIIPLQVYVFTKKKFKSLKTEWKYRTHSIKSSTWLNHRHFTKWVEQHDQDEQERKTVKGLI